MKTKLLNLMLLIALLISSKVSFSQEPKERYYIVVLKGSVVRNTLANFPSFSYFDFTFKPLSNFNYSLEGYAKDISGKPLGDKIEFDTLVSRPSKPFKNIQKGHLYLVLATLRNFNVDGSEDYVLTPKKCKDKSGNNVDYVSYRFDNKIEESNTSQLGYFGVRGFNLNPSPPY